MNPVPRLSMRHRILAGVVALAAAIAVATGWSQSTERTAAITVLPAQTHQTMAGWEVTPRYWEMNKAENRYDNSWQPHRELILDRMVNELGINRIRLEYRSGFENPVDYWSQFVAGKLSYRDLGPYWYRAINDNDDPRVANAAGFQFANLDFQVEQVLLPMRRLMEANGERLFVNLCFVDFSSAGSNIEHALAPDEYAELTLQTFLHLKNKFGIVPDALEIILEPDNTEHWRGRQIGLAIVAAMDRLRRAGFSPQVIAPSVSKAGNFAAYFDAMIAVPGVLPLLHTAAYHRYDIQSGRAIPDIRKRADQHKLQTGMLELLSGNADVLHGDLKDMNASAWQMWGIANRMTTPGSVTKSFYYEVDLSDPARPRARMTPASRGLAQYFRYIRIGAVRVGATTDYDAFDPVAFRNTDGTFVVAVKAARGGRISVAGLPPGTYGIRYTTTAEAIDLPPVRIEAGQAIPAAIPAGGVLTVHQKRS